jgi:hypothetical protein
MDWTKLVAALTLLLKSLFDHKEREIGKAQARTESLENQARSISKAREIERDAEDKHRRGGDAAYDPELFRD